MGAIFFSDNQYLDEDDIVNIPNSSELEGYLASLSPKPSPPIISKDEGGRLEEILATFEE